MAEKESDSAACPNNVACRTCSCASAFRADRDRYRRALANLLGCIEYNDDAHEYRDAIHEARKALDG